MTLHKGILIMGDIFKYSFLFMKQKKFSIHNYERTFTLKTDLLYIYS